MIQERRIIKKPIAYTGTWLKNDTNEITEKKKLFSKSFQKVTAKSGYVMLMWPKSSRAIRNFFFQRSPSNQKKIDRDVRNQYKWGSPVARRRDK